MRITMELSCLCRHAAASCGTSVLSAQEHAHAPDCGAALLAFLRRFSSIGAARETFLAHASNSTAAEPAAGVPVLQAGITSSSSGATTLATDFCLQYPLTRRDCSQ
jgi:hypothetical protein